MLTGKARSLCITKWEYRDLIRLLYEFRGRLHTLFLKPSPFIWLKLTYIDMCAIKFYSQSDVDEKLK